MREAHGETRRHRIGTDRCRDDRDRVGGLLRDLRSSRGIGDDDVDRQPDQIGRQCRQSVVTPGSEAILDLDVRSLDIAELTEPAAKGVERLRR